MGARQGGRSKNEGEWNGTCAEGGCDQDEGAKVEGCEREHDDFERRRLPNERSSTELKLLLKRLDIVIHQACAKGQRQGKRTS